MLLVVIKISATTVKIFSKKIPQVTGKKLYFLIVYTQNNLIRLETEDISLVPKKHPEKQPNQNKTSKTSQKSKGLNKGILLYWSEKVTEIR